MPQFTPSSVHSATVTFANPKSAGFDYRAGLCMGTGMTEMASASFHLDAGQSKAIAFSVTMPSAPGTYPVYFKVTCSGVLIGTFVATENVVIVGALAFTFGTPSVSLVTCISATAWRVADVACDITNPNSVVVTRKIACYWASVGALDLYERNWEDGSVWRSLTLNPGQTIRLVSPGNVGTDPVTSWSNSPLYPIQPRQFNYYFLDDLGNRSPAGLG